MAPIEPAYGSWFVQNVEPIRPRQSSHADVGLSPVGLNCAFRASGAHILLKNRVAAFTWLLQSTISKSFFSISVEIGMFQPDDVPTPSWHELAP